MHIIPRRFKKYFESQRFKILIGFNIAVLLHFATSFPRFKLFGIVNPINIAMLSGAIFSPDKSSQIGANIDKYLLQRVKLDSAFSKNFKRKTLWYFWIPLITITFLILVFLIFPLSNTWVIEKFNLSSNKFFDPINTPHTKKWIDFFILVLEFLLIILMGGAIFTEVSANKVQKIVNKWEAVSDQNVARLTTDEITFRDSLNSEIQIIHNSIISHNFENKSITQIKKFFVENLKQGEQVFSKYHTHLTKNVPSLIAKSVSVRALQAFPGGTYGMIAFFFFIIMSLLKILKYYVDHTPVL